MRPAVARLVVAGAVSGLLLALACGGPYADLSPDQREVAVRGRQLYEDHACGRCHGERREGQRTAPPLTGLAQHWTADALVGYLRDPGEVRGQVPRLLQLGDTYSLKMPPIDAPEDELRDLAEYLILDPPEA